MTSWLRSRDRSEYFPLAVSYDESNRDEEEREDAPRQHTSRRSSWNVRAMVSLVGIALLLGFIAGRVTQPTHNEAQQLMTTLTNTPPPTPEPSESPQQPSNVTTSTSSTQPPSLPSSSSSPSSQSNGSRFSSSSSSTGGNSSVNDLIDAVDSYVSHQASSSTSLSSSRSSSLSSSASSSSLDDVVDDTHRDPGSFSGGSGSNALSPGSLTDDSQSHTGSGSLAVYDDDVDATKSTRANPVLLSSLQTLWKALILRRRDALANDTAPCDRLTSELPLFGSIDATDHMQERCPWLEEVDSEFVRSHANDTTETFTDLLARAAESRLEGNAVRATQRMNQAWLLKPEDPRCYAAFGGILAQNLDSLSSKAPTDTFDSFFAPNPTLVRLSSLYFLQEALVRGMDTVESLQQAGIASLAAAWDLLDTGETLADIVIQTEGLENVTTDLLIRVAVSLLNDALVRQNASSSTLWALTLVSDASTRMTRGDWSGAREDHRLATTYVNGDTPSHNESLSWFFVVLQRLDAFLSEHDA